MISGSASVRTDYTDRNAAAMLIKVRFVKCANANTCMHTFSVSCSDFWKVIPICAVIEQQLLIPL